MNGLPLNEIIHGDCLEVMRQFPDKSIDMILCDLPYGTTACKWDTIIPFEPLWEQYKRLIKSNGAIALTASQPFSSALIASNMDMFKYCWYWEKPKGANFSAVKWQPLKVIEEIAIFSNGACTFAGEKACYLKFNPQCIPLTKPYKRDFRRNKSKSETTFLRNQNAGEVEYTHLHPRNLLYASTDGDGRVHPTQKPVALFEYLIRTYTNEGEIVLDNCIGSGTTAIACINIGRNFIGIEKEEKYVRIAQKRIEACKKQNQMRLFPLSKLEKPPKRYKGLFE